MALARQFEPSRFSSIAEHAAQARIAKLGRHLSEGAGLRDSVASLNKAGGVAAGPRSFPELAGLLCI